MSRHAIGYALLGTAIALAAAGDTRAAARPGDDLQAVLDRGEDLVLRPV